ncbi:MAG: histidine kinase N-terminal 7TM domain-containing protein, partial [Chloroflexota bacterium]
MILKYLSILLPYLSSVTICIWVGWLARTRKQDSASKALAGMAFSQAVWIGAYIFQINASGLGAVLFWNNIQFLAAAALPVFYLGFALDYNYRQISFHRINWRYLFVLTSGLVLFIWLDGIHGLFRTNPQVVREELFYRLVFVDGPLFNLYTIYAYTLIVIGTLFFIVKYIAAPRLFRAQVGILLLGVIIPWITSIITALRIVPFFLHDIVPITFGISNLVIAWALFRYHLLDIVPIARDMLFENMADAVIVVDPRNRIMDANPAAYRLLAAQPESLVARDINALLPLASNWADFGIDQSTKITELSIPAKGIIQHFQVKVNRLSLQGREVNGYVLTLHNITEQKQIELHLRRSMALIQATIDSAGSGILVFDQQLNVLIHNQRMADLFELPANWQNNIDQ